MSDGYDRVREMPQVKPARIFTFTDVQVYITPENEKIIQWWLNPYFKFESSVVGFHVEYARSGGEWCRITDTMITNVCLYLDEDSYRCGMDNDVWYRIIAVDANGVEYVSRPAHTLGEMNRHDWLVARDILRKEYLRLHRYVGTFGYLLKKREHGTKCSECADYDMEEPIGLCTNCFGTGFKYGYYNAIGFFLDLSGVSSSRDVKEPFGIEDTRIRNARAVAFPWVGTYDIWVHGSANRRYVLRKVVTATEIRSVPLVYFPIELRLLEASNIAYQIPMTQELELPDAGMPCANPQQGGWRRGIDFDEVF